MVISGDMVERDTLNAHVISPRSLHPTGKPLAILDDERQRMSRQINRVPKSYGKATSQAPQSRTPSMALPERSSQRSHSSERSL
jgi:hypothetical protein